MGRRPTPTPRRQSITEPEPWRRDADDVAAEFGADVRDGLTSAEAEARLARDGPNDR
ncbi:MAG TPA: cation-transporting P-type ATPase [Actinomycetota bacterium]